MSPQAKSDARHSVSIRIFTKNYLFLYFRILVFFLYYGAGKEVHYGVAHGGTSSEDTLTVINRGRQWGKIETKDDNLDMDTGD